MDKTKISLLYTTARPHLIDEVINRWFQGDGVEIEMVVVTDDPYAAAVSSFNVKFLRNEGRRDCVTGWNLAAKNSTGEILIQVSDDLFPPANWDSRIRSIISNVRATLKRSDVVVNLLDERKEKNAVFHPVLTRSAYERTLFLYPPEFQSMYCDNWFCFYHRKYSAYAVSESVFWHHNHRTTHKVEIDEVMKTHESPERFSRGREVLESYIVKHKLL